MNTHMISVILLIVIILCEIWGITAVDREKLLGSMIYYTQLSNVAALFSAALLLVFGPLSWITAFRYLAVCMLVMTCLVTVFILRPLIKNDYILLWCRSGFFLHLVCPFLNVISYSFLEAHVTARGMIIPPAVTLVYGVIMLYMNYINKIDGPYPFLRIHNQSKTATVIWIIVLLMVVSLISFTVYMPLR